MSTPFYTGGCQCGAVRFHVEGALGDASVCHCRMCQKASGNFYLPLVSVHDARLTWTRGRPKTFRSSSMALRGFCGDCGTPLFFDEIAAATLGIALGSLDDPDDVRPVEQSGVESRTVFFAHLHELAESECNSGEGGEARHLAILASNRQHPDYDTDHWPPQEEP